MKRMNLLFAALLVAATVAAPLANAQTVHYIGAGSSAMFQGFGVAAFNDLAQPILSANPGFTAHHWSEKSSNSPGTWAGLVDSRTPSGGTPPPVEYGNIWVVWVDNASGTPTDIWAYASVDSTVGNRTYLAQPRAKLLLAAADTTTPGVNAIANTLFVGGQADESSLDTNVYNALGGSVGLAITAGMTDIRPEDALLATNRILGTVPSAGFPSGTANACPPSDTGVPGAAAPTCSDFPYFYSFALGYGPGMIGTGIQSSQSATVATPVAFALPGFNDPITGTPVPNTIKVFPVGESPIVFIANRSNASGLGQIIGSHPACGSTNPVNCTATGWTSDGSYYVRNLWDQHPYPATTVFPSTSEPTVGYCSVAANQSSATCHITRRPMGNMFAGNLCEGRNTAFSWPLDPALEGARTTIPNGTDFPVNLIVREPLSGTYNTVEFTEIRRMGTTTGNLTKDSGLYGKPPYISQESNVQIANPNNNPLKIACQAGFADTDTEGLRERAIGTGEEVSTVKKIADSIGYTFFSFGNVSSIGGSTSYGYLMVDGIDPLFADYENNAGNPGQPASPTTPTTWGELPTCSTSGGTPACNVSAIWASGNSYPNLRNGTYPAWSELRLICDTADTHCTTTADPNGAEALLQNLQADIHFGHLGGVPDLLPFADGGPAVFGNGAYGDAGFVRTHYAFVSANDNSEFNNIAPYSNATPATTHQSNTLVQFGGSGSCTTANQAINGPTPQSECGGDAGGFIIAAPPASGASNGQLQ